LSVRYPGLAGGRVLPSNAQFQEARTQVNARAPLSPIGRRRVVERVCVEGWSVAAGAEAAGVTERTVYRWLARFCREGVAGLVDRPPVARRQPAKTPPQRVRLICLLRRLWIPSQAQASPAPAIRHPSPRPRRSAMSQGTEFHRSRTGGPPSERRPANSTRRNTTRPTGIELTSRRSPLRAGHRPSVRIA